MRQDGLKEKTLLTFLAPVACIGPIAAVSMAKQRARNPARPVLLAIRRSKNPWRR